MLKKFHLMIIFYHPNDSGLYKMMNERFFYDLVNCLKPRKNDFSCKIIFLHECARLSIISRSIMNVLSIDNNYDGTIKIIFSYMINS